MRQRACIKKCQLQKLKSPRGDNTKTYYPLVQLQKQYRKQI